MRAPATQALLGELNAARGLKYPSVGYVYFADIKGDGQKHYAVWEVITLGGGVRRPSLNHRSGKVRCAMIRKEIAGIKAPQRRRKGLK